MKKYPATWKPELGDIVQIVFNDHTTGGTGHLQFTVWGRLAKITRPAYSIHVWDFTEPSPDEDQSNVESFTIVKGAILSISKLVPCK